jgi:hypothetical protein
MGFSGHISAFMNILIQFLKKTFVSRLDKFKKKNRYLLELSINSRKIYRADPESRYSTMICIKCRIFLGGSILHISELVI